MKENSQAKPILWIVIPCYNEEAVLPLTGPLFRQKLQSLCDAGLISSRSRILFVNDGSRDRTWELICGMASKDEAFLGISQSRNRPSERGAGGPDGGPEPVRRDHLHRLRRAG